MELSAYSANQRRAINLVWTACGDYRFEPQFLALRSDGTPDFYMNCVIGFVHKWLGDRDAAPAFLPYGRATCVRRCWTTLRGWHWKTPSMKRNFPCGRACTAALRPCCGVFCVRIPAFTAGVDEQNQLVYSLQSARWRSVLGQKPPLLTPLEKGLSAALDCSGTLDADKIEAAVCAAFQTYLHFNGAVPGKSPFRLHFSDKWVPLLTKLLPTELVRTDELTPRPLCGSGGKRRGACVQCPALSAPLK